jgi:hypothetical protein
MDLLAGSPVSGSGVNQAKISGHPLPSPPGSALRDLCSGTTFTGLAPLNEMASIMTWERSRNKPLHRRAESIHSSSAFRVMRFHVGTRPTGVRPVMAEDPPRRRPWEEVSGQDAVPDAEAPARERVGWWRTDAPSTTPNFNPVNDLNPKGNLFS